LSFPLGIRKGRILNAQKGDLVNHPFDEGIKRKCSISALLANDS
jgi:hypothetical protein